MGSLVAAAAAVLLCFSASEAFAGFTPVGSPTLDHSWIQSFVADTNIATQGAFDRIEITIQSGSGSDLEDPAATTFTNFNGTTNGSWSQSGASFNAHGTGFLNANVTGTTSSLSTNPNDVGTADDQYYLRMNLHFTNFPQNGVHFIARLFNGTTLVESDDVLIAATVPLPASVWTGLAMFAGMGAFLVKRRRDRSILV
jgi:hypothetical protein